MFLANDDIVWAVAPVPARNGATTGGIALMHVLFAKNLKCTLGTRYISYVGNAAAICYNTDST